jgi:hypothetical protein
LENMAKQAPTVSLNDGRNWFIGMAHKALSQIEKA